MAPEPTSTFSAWIALGSNLGDSNAILKLALNDIRKLGNITATSSFWRTNPVGKTDQPMFLNAAAQMETSLQPVALIQALLAIELKHGRDRSKANEGGPRTLDLDLLLMETAGRPVIVEEGDLVLPHPRLHTRRFVLTPLSEIAPRLHHPALHKTVHQLLQELPTSGVNGVDSVRRAEAS